MHLLQLAPEKLDKPANVIIKQVTLALLAARRATATKAPTKPLLTLKATSDTYGALRQGKYRICIFLNCCFELIILNLMEFKRTRLSRFSHHLERFQLPRTSSTYSTLKFQLVCR
jgi:hypothetical protein